MNTRLEVAAAIYARLILRDLSYAIAKPEKFAHRALLFADALLLSDQQSAPVKALDGQPIEAQKQPRRIQPPLADRVNERRTNRPTLH